MQNLRSLYLSVQAVGGGGSKMLMHMLYSKKTFKYCMRRETDMCGRLDLHHASAMYPVLCVARAIAQ